MAHVPRIHIPGKASSGTITLDGEPARRLAKVMRLRAGDDFLLFAGDGREYRATIEHVLRNSVTARVGEVVRHESTPEVTVEVWVGLVRASRFDDAVEKCTEAGADIIRPVVTEHAARGESASAQRQERWDRIASEAAEQSGRLFVPVVASPAPLERLLERHRGTLVLAHPEGQPWARTAALLPARGLVAAAVGPEGGFSDAEVAAARARGALITRIAPHILRTETAATVLTALVRSATG